MQWLSTKLPTHRKQILLKLLSAQYSYEHSSIFWMGHVSTGGGTSSVGGVSGGGVVISIVVGGGDVSGS